uniref:VWFD domain-containing protein n=1 Tax=Odontella aurita TaxID=265563 RepID=A0A7S4IIH1_9STRA|mmetsp:Transcript_25615/g.75605  ORF Transcript_25615/g.75605 Transcript_25615/m.75605 type:complete len:484 (+) Transcript_25615:782-2233(+)
MHFIIATLALLASPMPFCQAYIDPDLIVVEADLVEGYCITARGGETNDISNSPPLNILNIHADNIAVNFDIEQTFRNELSWMAVSINDCNDSCGEQKSKSKRKSRSKSGGGGRKCMKAESVTMGVNTDIIECNPDSSGKPYPRRKACCEEGKFAIVDIFWQDGKIAKWKIPGKPNNRDEVGLCTLSNTSHDWISDCMDTHYEDCEPPGGWDKKCWFRYKIPCESGGGGGDPHITTWSGEKFDFHGECDLVLINNPEFAYGLGMNVHGRTKIHDNWSAFESIAVQIGDFTLEVQGTDYYWINGTPNVELPHTLSGYKVEVRSEEAEEPNKIRVYTIHVGENGEHIFIRAHDDMMWVQVWGFKDEDFDGSLGLFGSYGSGHKVGRDGVTLFDDPIAFGQEWQVTDADSKLFHNDEGPQYPEKCTIPENAYSDAAEIIQRLRWTTEGETLYESAQKVCAKAAARNVQDCIYDIMATSRLDLAAEYQ